MINAGDYVMLKPVAKVKNIYKAWKTINTSNDVFIDTGDRFFSSAMLKAMDTPIPYRVAWVDNDRVCVYIDNGAYIFDEKCIKGVYKLVQVD